MSQTRKLSGFGFRVLQVPARLFACVGVLALVWSCYLPIGGYEFDSSGDGYQPVDPSRPQSPADSEPDKPLLLDSSDEMLKWLQPKGAEQEWDADALGGHYRLTSDLNLGSDELEGEEWVPIGRGTDDGFTGSFDGNGHSITGLTINANGDAGDDWGLFAVIGESGEVRYLGLEDGTMNGEGKPERIGLLAGTNKGTIEYAFVTGDIYNGYDRTGGLVGSNSGIIRYSYARVSDLEGNNRVGGLVGENTAAGDITETYAASTITTNAAFKGGLVGRNDGGASIRGSFFDQEINDDDGLDAVGWEGADGTVEHVYGLSTEQAQNVDVLTGNELDFALSFDFDTIWTIDEECNTDNANCCNKGYPYLQANKPVACR